jgi:Cu/Ag efflux protein CusF
MTMPFKLASPALATGLRKGQPVSFGFDKQGDDYRVTEIAPSQTAAASGGRP